MCSLDPEFIESAVSRILAVVRPNRVILFGSAAAGEMSRDSDVDLLVLMDSSSDPLKESVRIRRSIGKMGRPFDVIVMKTERFETTKNLVGGLAYPANKYGKVIYASS